jgi:DNA-binding MarR family transcriptional regulator
MQISDSLQQFILNHINSVEQLEILLMLAGDPSAARTPEEIARMLFTQPQSVATRLDELAAAGLVCLKKDAERENAYVYMPRRPELAAAVAELTNEYPKYRVSIINLIFSKPIDRIRTFADAFRFTKREEGEDK